MPPPDAAEPVVNVRPHLHLDRFGQYDFGEAESTAGLEYPRNLGHDGMLIRRQVEDAVCRYHVEMVSRKWNRLCTGAEDLGLLEASLGQVLGCRGNHGPGAIKAGQAFGSSKPPRVETEVQSSATTKVQEFLPRCQFNGSLRIACTGKRRSTCCRKRIELGRVIADCLGKLPPDWEAVRLPRRFGNAAIAIEDRITDLLGSHVRKRSCRSVHGQADGWGVVRR